MNEQTNAARRDLGALMHQMKGYPPRRMAVAVWEWMRAQGFEQAHTPSDDERTPYLPADLYNRLQMHLLGSGNREALLLAGEVQSLTGASTLRRRTAVQEPSIECPPHWSPGRITMRKGCTACAAESEPQGEPTDAEARALMRSLTESGLDWDDMHRYPDQFEAEFEVVARAALRAAYETRGEGR